MQLSIRHLLGLDGVSEQDITTILDTADAMKSVLQRPIPKVPTLKGKTVVNLFYENSTRTRISFELAEKRLSADTVNFSTSTSSVKKGETLKDTIKNIEAMRIDYVVMRHGVPGSSHYLANCVDASVVNAGDGPHEHPTQALLDMMTIREKRGTLKGLKVCLVGDITHSRVSRSNVYGLLACGAEVGVCGPATLIPYDMQDMGITVYPHIEDALAESDVLNVLRIQLERQKGALFPTLREYRNLFGITEARLTKAKSDVTICHPGPMNRGVEIDSEVADGPQAVILDQVTNGVAVRMAILYLLAGGRSSFEGVENE